MQAGHFAASLAIATFFDWNAPTVLYSVGIHWLPNADALAIQAGWADEDFHPHISFCYYSQRIDWHILTILWVANFC